MTEFAIYVSAVTATAHRHYNSIQRPPASQLSFLPPSSLVMFAIAAEETSTASRFL